MKHLKKLLLIMLTAAIVFSMSACDNSKKQAKKSSTVTIAMAGCTPFDPCAPSRDISIKLMDNVFDTLVRINSETNEIEPRAAKRWTISDDGLVYTFYLHEGMKFHDGSEVTADDVVYSISRTMNSPYTMSNSESIEKVEAIGKYTAAITLKAPFSPFLGLISQYFFSIMNKADVEAAGDTYGTKAIGSGPYVLKEWKSDSFIKLTAFKDYHMGEPQIKEVNIKIIPDYLSQVLSLQKGEVDYIYSQMPKDVEKLKDNEKYSHYTFVMDAIDNLYMNEEVAGLNDKRVRQAISLALNYNDILQYLCDGDGIVPVNHSFFELPGYPTDAPEREINNIEKAKMLWKEAALPEDTKFNIMVYDDTLVNLAQIIQASLEKIGIKINITRVEHSVMIERAANGDFEMCIMGESYPYPDTYGYLASIYHSSSINVLNTSRYNNPAFDELLDKAKIALDMNEREMLYKEALEILIEDMPVVPLDRPTAVTVSKSNLCGITDGNKVDIYNWYWSNSNQP